jgi:hypothetical protein
VADAAASDGGIDILVNAGANAAWGWIEELTHIDDALGLESRVGTLTG